MCIVCEHREDVKPRNLCCTDPLCCALTACSQVEMGKARAEEARELGQRQGFEAGREAAVKEMSAAEMKAAVAARAEATVRMQERAQADVAKALAAAQQRAAGQQNSAATAAEASGPAQQGAATPTPMAAGTMLPGVAEAIAAAEAAAKERTLKTTEAVVKAASSKWGGDAF